MSKNQKPKSMEEKPKKTIPENEIIQEKIDPIPEGNANESEKVDGNSNQDGNANEVEKPDEVDKPDEVEKPDEFETPDEEKQKLKSRCEAYLHSSFGWRQAINLFYAIEKNPSKRIKVVNLGDSPAGRSIIDAAVKDFING